MEREILFAKMLETVKKQAKENGNMITEAAVKIAFEPLELKEEQLQLVYDYLEKHKIGIGEAPNMDEFLTDEEHQYLEDYLKDIEQLGAKNPGEREAVILAAMAGEMSARDRLIEIYLSKVVEIAKLYTGQGVYLEDLIGEGNIALTMGVTLLGALENSQEAEGALVRQIMDAMEALITQNLEADEADREMVKRVNQVADAARELSEELLRKVTVEELSRETGLPPEEIMEAVRISGKNIDTIEDYYNDAGK